MTWLYFLIFIISSLTVIQASRWVVKSLIRISHFLKWRQFIVTAVLMAFATSLPELFIGITAALEHVPRVSVGDVIGSNVMALTVVIGVGALLAKGLNFRGKTLRRAAFDASIIALLPLFLILDGRFSRPDGIVLLAALAFYFRQLLAYEEMFTKVLANSFKAKDGKAKAFFKSLGIFFLAVVLLLISAEGIVYSSNKLAQAFKIPLLSIGVLFVALGTSLPEITFGVRSITMGHKEMIIGDVIGSVVLNSTLVLGIVVLIRPFEVANIYPYVVGTIFTALTSLFFVIFSRSHENVSVKEAIFLLFIYIIFVLFQIYVAGG